MKQWIERLTTPPSWRAIRAMNIFLAVACTALAIITENRWIALMDAFLAGTGTAAALHITAQIKMRKAVDGMHEAFDAMVELNNALVQDNVRLIIARGEPDSDSPPTAPRLH